MHFGMTAAKASITTGRNTSNLLTVVLISIVFWKKSNFTKFHANYNTVHIVFMLIGVISMCSFSLGPVVSGIIVSKMKVTPTRALGLVIAIHVISVTGFILLMFIGCPQGDWAGDVTVQGYVMLT